MFGVCGGQSELKIWLKLVPEKRREQLHRLKIVKREGRQNREKKRERNISPQESGRSQHGNILIGASFLKTEKGRRVM